MYPLFSRLSCLSRRTLQKALPLCLESKGAFINSTNNGSRIEWIKRHKRYYQHYSNGRALRKGLASRPPREDLDLPTSLDGLFSDWKVLVGPDDWQNHYIGREGAVKYRLHNLPSTDCFHSGVYELALYHAHGPRKGTSRSLKKDALVPVYVGQAENVRDRLQDYGRNGSHLEGSLRGGKCQQCETSLIRLYQNNLGFLARIFATSNKELCSSAHLFTSSFVQGYSIAFRWTDTESKAHAATLEARLLQSYNYAWNKGSNGKRRPEDAFKKLQHISKARTWYNPKWIIKLHKLCGLLDNQVTRLSFPDENTRQMFKMLSISLRRKVTEEKNSSSFELICSKKNSPSSELICSKKHNGHGHNETIVCGIMDGSGNICTSIPPPGRKRCEAHKGMRRRRFRTTAGSSILTKKPIVNGHNETIVCGIMDDSGNICTSIPPPGRKRCEAHKGMRQRRFRPTASSSILTKKPIVYGQSEIDVSREDGKGVADDFSMIRKHSATLQACNGSGAKKLICEFEKGSVPLVCGYISKDGLKCMVLPEKGRKRCTSHKGRRIRMSSVDGG